MMSKLHASLFYHATVSEIFSDQALVRYLLQVEVALAHAEAQVGVIPYQAAQIIQQVVHDQGIHAFDFEQLYSCSAVAGNIAIPFVQQLTAAVKQVDPAAASYVHWGASSQDILDTACILQARDAFHVVVQQLQHAYCICLNLARQYREQIMIGRLESQHALPVSFGYKAARWASSLRRDLDRLTEIKARIFSAQLGGSVGTLATLQDQATAVLVAFAQQLELAAPSCSWHSERDRMVEMASLLGIIVGNMGKMAQDWSLLMQPEIDELTQPMSQANGAAWNSPHQHESVASAAILTAAQRVPLLICSLYQGLAQAHERSLSHWQLEWLAIPEIFKLCSGALMHGIDVLQGLKPHTMQMFANIEISHGLMMAETVINALTPQIGRSVAEDQVRRCCQQAKIEHKHLKMLILHCETLRPYLSAAQIDALFQPENHLGNMQTQINAVLNEAKLSVPMKPTLISNHGC